MTGSTSCWGALFDPDSAAAAADFLARAAVKDDGRPAFVWGRSILKSPRWYAEVARELRARHPEARVEFVDPYTFFGLIRLSLSNAPAPPADAAPGSGNGP